MDAGLGAATAETQVAVAHDAKQADSTQAKLVPNMQGATASDTEAASMHRVATRLGQAVGEPWVLARRAMADIEPGPRCVARPSVKIHLARWDEHREPWTATDPVQRAASAQAGAAATFATACANIG
jgi:uncharacterized protein YbjT (DUF2867 family)